MSFAALVGTKPPRTRKGPACSVGIFLEALPEEEARGLAALLDPDSGWSSEAIARAIQEAGGEIIGQTVGRHRRGGCSCGVR